MGVDKGTQDREANEYVVSVMKYVHRLTNVKLFNLV